MPDCLIVITGRVVRARYRAGTRQAAEDVLRSAPLRLPGRQRKTFSAFQAGSGRRSPPSRQAAEDVLRSAPLRCRSAPLPIRSAADPLRCRSAPLPIRSAADPLRLPGTHPQPGTRQRRTSSAFQRSAFQAAENVFRLPALRLPGTYPPEEGFWMVGLSQLGCLHEGV
jgi:hypothetical protein